MDASKLSDPSLTPGSRFGPYVLERRIAVGGMAEIYLARTQGMAGFEKQLALKVIHADMAADATFVRMLVAEAKLAVQLTHTNIVQTFDLGKIDDLYFIAMEYIDGADYYELLKRLTAGGQQVPIEAALYVAHEVVAALEYAHQKLDDKGRPLGLIHRDISPQNVLISRNGHVKLADFGIAKIANASSQTRAGVIKGKLVYMSPEQAWGERIDARSDIFSVGVVLYESLTGGSLYLEDNPVKLLHQVRKAEIARPSTLRAGLDQELDEIVMRALARQPEHRYQSAAELGLALQTIIRRTTPHFGSRELAELMRRAIDDDTTNATTKGRRRVSAAAGAVPDPAKAPTDPLKPDQFALSEHSLIRDLDEQTPVESPGAQRAQHARAGVSKVLLVLDGEDGRSVVVGDEVTIGRANPDLRLTDGRVSRRHAQIVRREGMHLLEDLRSANGTYLNDQRIERATPLRFGDVIRVGPYQFRYLNERDQQPLAPTRPARAPGSATRVEDAQLLSAEMDAPTPPPYAPEGRSMALTPAGALILDLADQSVSLPIEDVLTIDHKLDVGLVPLDVLNAQVKRRADGYWIEPAIGSAVMINGEALREARRLVSGDRILLGNVVARFSTEVEG